MITRPICQVNSGDSTTYPSAGASKRGLSPSSNIFPLSFQERGIQGVRSTSIIDSPNSISVDFNRRKKG
jgi:hypothetical protein